MTDIQIKSTDICKRVFLSILPTYVESARKDIKEGSVDYESAMKGAWTAAVNAAIHITRQWLEY